MNCRSTVITDCEATFTTSTPCEVVTYAVRPLGENANPLGLTLVQVIPPTTWLSAASWRWLGGESDSYPVWQRP